MTGSGEVTAIGARLRLDRGAHRGDSPIHKLTITIGPRSYWLESDRSSIRCWTEVSSSDRGLVTEQLRFQAWATELFDEIARQNLVNYESLVALRQLVVHDQVD